MEIAESFGAKVLHHEWTGDFSAARNVGLRRRDRRLADVPRRRRGPRRRRRRAPARAARPHLARGVSSSSRPTTPATWRTAPPSRTTRCACSATARAYRFEGRIHEQIAHKLPGSPRAPRVLAASASSTSATSAPSATPRRSRAATSSCWSARSPRASTARSCTSTSAPSSPPPATPPACAGRARARLGRRWSDDPDRPQLRLLPRRCARACVKALHVNGRPHEAIAQADDDPRAAARASPTSSSSRRWPAAASATSSSAIARFERCHGDGRRPRALQRDGRRRHLPRPRRARRRPDRRRPPRRGRGASCAACWREHPGFVGAVEPYARVLLRRRRRRPPRSTARVADAVGRADARRRASCWPSRSTRPAPSSRPRRELRAVARRRSPAPHAARVALAEALLSPGPPRRRGADRRRGPGRRAVRRAAARTRLFARWRPAADDGAARRGLRLRARTPAPRRPSWPPSRPGAAGTAAPARRRPGRAAGRRSCSRRSRASRRFEAFERLAGVVERLDLPWRERRELLAGVYLPPRVPRVRRRRVDRRRRAARRARRARAAGPGPASPTPRAWTRTPQLLRDEAAALAAAETTDGRAAKPLLDDPTIGRSSMPLLKGLPGTPMTGETRADGPRMGRTDFERIEMDIDATNGHRHRGRPRAGARPHRPRRPASSHASSTSRGAAGAA